MRTTQTYNNIMMLMMMMMMMMVLRDRNKNELAASRGRRDAKNEPKYILNCTNKLDSKINFQQVNREGRATRHCRR